jgi:hypothetical protein
MHVFGNAWPLCAVLSCCVLLSGCMTPWLKARYETADAAQGLVTPAIIADCSERVVKAYPNLTIAGPFALNGYAAARVASSKLSLEAVPEKNLVALVARTTNKGLFGQENRGHAGCSYHVESGRLVFQEVHGIAVFGPQVYVVPMR